MGIDGRISGFLSQWVCLLDKRARTWRLKVMKTRVVFMTIQGSRSAGISRGCREFVIRRAEVSIAISWLPWSDDAMQVYTYCCEARFCWDQPQGKFIYSTTCLPHQSNAPFRLQLSTGRKLSKTTRAQPVRLRDIVACGLMSGNYAFWVATPMILAHVPLEDLWTGRSPCKFQHVPNWSPDYC